MRNYYYILWVDAITRFKRYQPKRKDWKITLLIFLTWMNALNLWIILIWLKYFNVFTIPLIKLDLFPGSMLDSFLSFAIEFALPFFVINYFLVFRNNHYEFLIRKYSDKDWNIAAPYSMIIALGALVSAIFYGLLTR